MLKFYKWNFHSTEVLAKSIESESFKLGELMEEAEHICGWAKESFEDIRKMRIELSKMRFHTGKKIKSSESIEKATIPKREGMRKKLAVIKKELKQLMIRLDRALNHIKKILYKANAILYKENNAIDEFEAKLKNRGASKEGYYKIVFQINELKEEMKTIARKVYEAFKSEEDKVFFAGENKTTARHLSNKIFSLGKEIESTGKAIQHLDANTVEDILDKSRNQLINIKKINLQSIILISRIEKMIRDTESKTHTLSDEDIKDFSKSVMDVEEKIEKTERDLTEQAIMLFEEIKIFPLSRV